MMNNGTNGREMLTAEEVHDLTGVRCPPCTTGQRSGNAGYELLAHITSG
jgi:hypothetical protein